MLAERFWAIVNPITIGVVCQLGAHLRIEMLAQQTKRPRRRKENKGVDLLSAHHLPDALSHALEEILGRQAVRITAVRAMQRKTHAVMNRATLDAGSARRSQVAEPFGPLGQATALMTFLEKPRMGGVSDND